MGLRHSLALYDTRRYRIPCRFYLYRRHITMILSAEYHSVRDHNTQDYVFQYDLLQDHIALYCGVQDRSIHDRLSSDRGVWCTPLCDIHILQKIVLSRRVICRPKFLIGFTTYPFLQYIHTSQKNYIVKFEC